MSVPDNKHSKVSLIFLVLTSLLCGTLIMVVEILGSRIIGPFFGVSLFVWSSIIAVTMLALAIGYAVGGVLSDRHGSPDYLYGIILLSGLLVCAIPYLKGPVLVACTPLGLRVGSFASCFILFGPPLLLLGCVSPYIIKLAASEMEYIGKTVGSFFAISTVGSVFGTVLTGFVLISYFSVSRIFLMVGAILMILAVSYFVFFRRRWFVAGVLLLPLIAVQLGSGPPVRVTLESGTVATLVESRDTNYGNLKVVDYRYGNKHHREMLLDGSVQSGIDMNTGMSVYPYYYLLGMLPHQINPEGKSCLVLGAGAGVIPMWYQARGIDVDVLDIDPAVIAVAEEYFGFRPEGRTVVADARYFLSNGEKLYDYIIMDIFNGESAPAHVISLEALRTVETRMTGTGVLALNLIGRLTDDNLMTASVVRTLEAVFDQVDIYPLFDVAENGVVGNISIVAYNGPAHVMDSDLMSYYPVHPFAAKEVRAALGNRYQLPEQTPAFILTDDYNPIDCYDNRVKEEIRKNILNGTPWQILLG